jgi:hypothetical protein
MTARYPIAYHERNWGARLTEWTYRGLRCLTLENEILRVSLLVDKGSDLFEFLHKPTDTDFLWRSPAGIRRPDVFVPTSSRPEGAFLDYYEGGWQECFPSGGTPAQAYGTPFGQHGEVCLIPWEYTILSDEPDVVQVRLWVRTYRTPFRLEKTLTLHRNAGLLAIDEVVVNEGQVAVDFVWGHHPALGAPFLDETCVLHLAGARVQVLDLGTPMRCQAGTGYTWPYVPGPAAKAVDLRGFPPHSQRTSDLAIFTALQAGWYAVTNRQRRVGFGLVWPLEVFPALWYWQEFHGVEAYPWYGRNYTIALEPWSTPDLNLPAAQATGTHRRLEPGESLRVWLKAVAYAGLTGVDRIGPEGTVEGGRSATEPG